MYCILSCTNKYEQFIFYNSYLLDLYQTTDTKNESTDVTDIQEMSNDGTINNYNVILLVDVFRCFSWYICRT